ncbi:hypothetical protein BDQ17DRAFT_1336383 [Cyathus striatus]|nr:hypothetical protein BDQ17DRAFT_1336383 [Cyathus striatus]
MDISNILPDLQISFLIPSMSSNQFQNIPTMLIVSWLLEIMARPVKDILVLNKYRITLQIARFQYTHYEATRYVHYLIEIVIPSLVKHICMVGSLESLQMNNIIDSDFNHNDFKKWADDITSLL